MLRFEARVANGSEQVWQADSTEAERLHGIPCRLPYFALTGLGERMAGRCMAAQTGMRKREAEVQ